jgi:hypothetical protein
MTPPGSPPGRIDFAIAPAISPSSIQPIIRMTMTLLVDPSRPPSAMGSGPCSRAERSKSGTRTERATPRERWSPEAVMLVPCWRRVLGRPSQSARPTCGVSGPTGRWQPHHRYRRDDLSQLRPALRGCGFIAWAFCDALSLRGRPRIVRYSRDAAPASPEALERNIQERAGDETLTPEQRR